MPPGPTHRRPPGAGPPLKATTELRLYLREAVQIAADIGAAAVLRDITLHLSGYLDPGHLDPLRILEGWDGAAPAPRLAPPPKLATPDLLGTTYESLLDAGLRRRAGAFYTPASLAQELGAATLGPVPDRGRLSVCDPAVGGGALLLGMIRAARSFGIDTRHLRLVAMDRDPQAVLVAEAAVRLLAPEAEVVVVAGDALGDPAWPAPGEGGFDAVVANPPFLSQLTRRTARSRSEAVELTGRFGDAASGYADAASLFCLLAVDLARPGGRIGLILPEPVLATRDGGPSRARAGSLASVDRLWLVPPRTFDAGVRACVVVMERNRKGPVDRDDRWSRGEWSTFAADAAGVPHCTVVAQGVVGDAASCTADFRDQFYGIAAIALDDADPGNPMRPPLITSGLIDVLHNRWGTRTARIAGRDLAFPRADLSRLSADDPLRAWAERRLVPKALLATQTTVLEAVPDPDGCLLPVVPVVSVVPHEGSVWPLLAVLSAPPITVISRRQFAGAALAGDAIKLSARQVAGLPLPVDPTAWQLGARAAQRASAASTEGDMVEWAIAMGELGTTMCAAYGIDPDTIVSWWWKRLEATHGRRSHGRSQGFQPRECQSQE